MRASQRFSTLVAATLTVVALTAACASRHPTPDTEPNPEPAPTEDDVRDVSVGYGTQAKRELTVAVGSVTERDIGQARVTRVEELLQGRVAGVQVSRRADGELSVRIRGASSLMGGGEPLWVLDNMPLNTSISGALAGLNPQDIERIDVLKDAGATAIYGSRGMYGVILIRTKRH
ncbi:MAG TPA: TonB-dependent receptor plug domain-containing protein [Gemmatimonadaceae bacterium]|nr:TonB-dependent receptor plug domain-containing protein [Gemmatimonadaceae bacterium]